MMGVYIKGIKTPAIVKVHYLNGRRYVEDPQSGEWREMVEIPPHGRLIEDVAVREQIDEWLDSVGDVVVGHGLSYYGELLGCIEDAPTIIPAEEEKV